MGLEMEPKKFSYSSSTASTEIGSEENSIYDLMRRDDRKMIDPLAMNLSIKIKLLKRQYYVVGYSLLTSLIESLTNAT